MLATVGHQGRSDIYEMRVPELIWWVVEVAQVYQHIKQVDPVDPTE